MDELKAVRDLLLKAHNDQARVQASTEHIYLGHSLSPEATAMRSQMLVCEHTVMGRGHMHTTENGDKEFRPNSEGDTDLIRLTDDKGKQVFVFMPHAPATAPAAPAPATAPAAPAPSPDPISSPAEVSTNTDAQTRMRTYKLQRAREEGERLDSSAEAELSALAMDTGEDAAQDQRRLDQIIAKLEPTADSTRWETKGDDRFKGRVIKRGEATRANSTATVAAADLRHQTTGHRPYTAAQATVTANQTVTEGPEVTAGAPIHGPVRPPMQPGQLGWCKHDRCINPLYGDEWPHTVCDMCFGPNSEECTAGFGARHEDTDEEPGLVSGDPADSEEDDTDSEDDATAPGGEPQWPPLGAAFGINICQPRAGSAAAPGAHGDQEASQHMGPVAIMPIHTMDAAPTPCTDPGPTVSVTVKGHNATNAPAMSGSEKALEEALLRDIT